MTTAQSGVVGPSRVRRVSLWAPSAGAVHVRIGGQDHACREVDGTWSAGVSAAAGDRYRFVVDGTVVPDPRSRHQPDGVHGPSAFVDLPDAGTDREVPWTGRGLERAVIHEIHVGTFSREGTFRGAVSHLDHLRDLGVTHVELMPVAAFAGRWGWGYDGVDLFAPHPAYGTPGDLAAFVDAAHDRNLAVLADVVHNHLGPDGNYLAATGPYFTNRYRTPWGDAVNLDGPGSDGVRRFLIDNALHWIEDIGVDGLRMDAVHELVDTSARPYLEQLATEVAAAGDRAGRQVTLIAESDRNDTRLVTAAPGGMGFDAHWSDDLHHALHVTLTGEGQGYYADYSPADVGRALTSGYVFQGDRPSTSRGLTPGRPVAGLRSDQLVVSLQNHDQVGNRAQGERLHHLVGSGAAGAAAALVLLSPFVALTFQGEEWGASTPFPYFTDFDGALGDAVSEGRRREFAAFGWARGDIAEPQDPATYRSACLEWDERHLSPHRPTLDWYRTLIGLRAGHPALAAGTLPRDGDRVDVDEGIVAVQRGSLSVVADLRARGDQRATRQPGDVLAVWGDSSHDGDRARTRPGSAVVVDVR